MDDSIKTWFEKLEKNQRDLLIEFTKSSTAMSTKLDIYIKNQDDHDDRLRHLEDYKSRQEGVNTESDRKANRILILVIASEVILFGIGLFLAKGM